MRTYVEGRTQIMLNDFSFSDSAEWVVAALLVVTLVVATLA